MIRIDARLLDKNCAASPEELSPAQSFRIAAAFGELAPWWLDTAVCTQAARGAAERGFPNFSWYLPRNALPVLPEGTCVLLLRGGKPSLRPAFVMPVQWIPNAGNGANLPQALCDIADRVRHWCQDDRKVSHQRWGLHLHPCLGGEAALDLTGLPFTFESAGASLAAGLLLRTYGGFPDNSVWATGVLAPGGGVGAVDDDGLAEKAALARDWNATKLFVPPGQARAAARPGLEVVEFSRETSPWGALREYLVQLRLPPGKDDHTPEGLQMRKLHHLYLLQAGRGDLARSFYRENLFPSIIRRCRHWLDEQEWANRPRFLVSIASDNPELVALTAAVLQPEKCLVFWTKDKERHLEAAMELLEQHAKSVQPIPVEFENNLEMGAFFTKAVEREFLGAKSDDLAFDLTPGSKLMSLTLSYTVAPAHSWLVYLRHEFYSSELVSRGGVEPFSERLQIWPTGQAWSAGMRDEEPLPITG